MADGNKKALRELAREVIVAPRMFREWRKLTKAPVRKVASGSATRVAIVPASRAISSARAATRR